MSQCFNLIIVVHHLLSFRLVSFQFVFQVVKFIVWRTMPWQRSIVSRPVPRLFRHFQTRWESDCRSRDTKPIINPNCKVAFITGGTSGIGLAAAKALLCEKAKAVVISGIDDKKGHEAAESLNDEYGSGKCTYMKMDVINMKGFEESMKATIAKYGSLDILFNNAGILNDKNWEDTLNINITGVVRGCLIGLRCMTKPGIIINCASTLGFDKFEYAPVYCTSQHGIIGLTKSLGDPAHYEKSQIRIVAICPGVTSTPLVDNLAEQLTDEWTRLTCEKLNSLPRQTTHATGQAIVHLIKHAETGSCWPIEGNILYKANVPKRQTFQVKIKDC